MSDKDLLKSILDSSVSSTVSFLDWVSFLEKNNVEVLPGNFSTENTNFSGCSFLYNKEKYIANKLGKKYSVPSLISSGLFFDRNSIFDKRKLESLYRKKLSNEQSVFLSDLSNNRLLPAGEKGCFEGIIKSIYDISAIVKTNGAKVKIKYSTVFDGDEIYSQTSLSILSPKCIQIRSLSVGDLFVTLDYLSKHDKKPKSIRIRSLSSSFSDLFSDGESCVSLLMPSIDESYRKTIYNVFMGIFDSKIYSAKQSLVDNLTGMEFFSIERYIDYVEHDFCTIRPRLLEI